MSAYNKQNPFLASIKERYSLSKPGSKKNTQHIVLDLRGSNLTYEVGDSVGIYSEHDPELIIKTLHALKASGDEKIHPKQGGEPISLYNYFRSKVSICDVPLKLIKLMHQRQHNFEKKHQLEELLKDENHAALKVYLAEHEVWDFLLAHEEVTFSPQELADLLMPLLPRFYSIASSQKSVGDEVHLAVAPMEYESRGHKRRGVCTHFLCSLVNLNEPVVPLFIQSTHNFKLPEEPDLPLIMIGPGTGIAPFRAFMQERLQRNVRGKHWVFFGEWNRDYDFFYEEEWKRWEEEGHLHIETAFSRDQQEKIYVQHKMQEHGEELFHWLENGAYLFVCGNADRMAKDVDAMLLTIVQQYGKMDLSQAKDYVKHLRQQKRYLRDVY